MKVSAAFAYLMPTGMELLPDLNGVYGATKVAIKPRDPKRRVIVRLAPVTIKAGELWYFRQILLREPVRSFTFSRGGYATFQEAAIAKGYVSDSNIVKSIMDESAMYSTARQMRSLFVILTMEGYPTLAVYHDPHYYHLMTADYEVTFASPAVVREELLQYFSRYFKAQGSQRHNQLYSYTTFT